MGASGLAGGPPYAVFLMGGAANGKSAVLRLRFRLIPPDEGDTDVDEDLPVLNGDRKLDPDEYKSAIAMYTPARDDQLSRSKFNKRRGLGGPSGPRTRSEYGRYPFPIRDSVEAYISARLKTTLAGFVEAYLACSNPHFHKDADWNFGGGLTHELSKAIAQVHLERFLNEVPATESFAWDAVGNAQTYPDWIKRAHAAGYIVRVIYVRAPLPVAQRWALQRERKLEPEIIASTYEKAAEAADAVKQYVLDFGCPDEVTFERVDHGDDELKETEALGFTGTGPPPV